jgi:hypothetical protein
MPTLPKECLALFEEYAMVTVFLCLVTLLFGLSVAHATLPYPILYVQSPRHDTAYRRLPDFFHPLNLEAGTHIMYLPANSSTPQLYLSGGTEGAVFDPTVSFDGTKVAYVYCPNVVNRNPAKANLPTGNCNLHQATAPNQGGGIVVEQLTFSEWTPSVGGEASPATLGHGVFNLGPTYLPGNKLMFVSSRNGLLANKSFTDVNLQLWVLDLTTGIQEQIGFMNLGSSLHPSIMTDGSVLFATYEAQGLRDRRLWGLWDILPDGRRWRPSWSAFQRESGVHLHTQLSNGDRCATAYYNKNNNGFGTINCWNNATTTPGFGAPAPANNAAIQQGYVGTSSTPRLWKYSFAPTGLYPRTKFADEMDTRSALINGVRVGKASHPRGAPGNTLLLSYCVGVCNHNPAPTTYGETYYDADIYLLADGVQAASVNDLTLVLGTTAYNEWAPVPLVPYAAIYGLSAPATQPWLPNSTHVALPKGTPFGLVGTSSFYKRDSAPGTPTAGTVERFNIIDAAARANFVWQGGDVGYYTNSAIEYVRLVILQGTSDNGLFNGSPFPYRTPANERLGFLPAISLRKTPNVLDGNGNPDTSFLAKIPADTVFTFQTLDAQHRVLNMAQTWHQVRPGETRVDCGGCHAHSQTPLDFATTVAGQAGYTPTDLGVAPVTTYEYATHIRPILANNCVACHGGSTPAGSLKLDVTTIDSNGYPNDFNRLANDPNAAWGTAPPVGTTWRIPNVSRYVRAFQSRRSLLAWRLYNARLDGIANGDTVTDVAGQDIDFVSAVSCTAHTIAESDKQIITAWIDTGAAGDNPGETAGFTSDEHKPTIRLVQGDRVRIGLVDAHSGLDMSTITVVHDAVDVTTSLTPTSTTGVWEVIGQASPGVWSVTACDNAGNCQQRDAVFP